MARINLDTGSMTDRELGVSTLIDRMMRERPSPANQRVVLTSNGNIIIPVRR